MSEPIEYKKGAHVQISKNFTSTEFDCPCAGFIADDCGHTPIDPELVAAMQRIRNSLMAPVKITSGFRCQSYQDHLKSQGYETAKMSQHLLGKAVDFTCGGKTGDQLEAVARGCGIKAVGVGAHFVHIDMREDKDRRWTYIKR